MRLPVAEELVDCHLRLPSFAQLRRDYPNTSHSMSALASMFQETSERFDVLAEIFGECDRAGYAPANLFVDGCLTLLFHVPRRYLPRLLEEGWSQDELDV